MEILANIWYYVVPFIILLGILVFVHEFGHFIVARLLGVQVEAFSIGFGKELWSRVDKKGTRWKLSLIPLGGYCQFLGDADASSSTTNENLQNLSEEEKKKVFALQSPWKKIAIVVAGPLFNYLLAVFLFIGMFYAYGKITYPSVVGEVMPNSAAEEAGIKAGDNILSINGVSTPDFQALSKEISMSETDNVKISIERPVNATMYAEEMEFCECGEIKKGKLIGVRSLESNFDENGVLKPVPPMINEVFPNSPAEKAGIVAGDLIETINGAPLTYFDDLKRYIVEHENDKLVLQGKHMLTLDVALRDTDYDEKIGGKAKRRMLGVKSAPHLTIVEKMSFTEALQAGFSEAYNLTAMTLRGVWQMITGQRGGQDVGGIIRIAELSGDVSKSGGISGFIYFMALISVNLGLINLFPIPVLDGGNLVIFVIEMLFGRELKPKVKEYIFRIGLLLILALMLFATWNDIIHLINRWSY